MPNYITVVARFIKDDYGMDYSNEHYLYKAVHNFIFEANGSYYLWSVNGNSDKVPSFIADFMYRLRGREAGMCRGYIKISHVEHSHLKDGITKKLIKYDEYVNRGPNSHYL